MPDHNTTKVHLEKTKTQENEEQALMAVSQSSYSGPIPPASELEKYNTILPGAADRILLMAETQLIHRTKIEKAVIEGNIGSQKLGVISGFIIGMTTIVGGTACILMGHDVTGLIFGGAGLTSLVSVFVYGTRTQSGERAEKRKALPRNVK